MIDSKYFKIVDWPKQKQLKVCKSKYLWLQTKLISLRMKTDRFGKRPIMNGRPSEEKEPKKGFSLAWKSFWQLLKSFGCSRLSNVDIYHSWRRRKTDSRIQYKHSTTLLRFLNGWTGSYIRGIHWIYTFVNYNGCIHLNKGVAIKRDVFV